MFFRFETHRDTKIGLKLMGPAFSESLYLMFLRMELLAFHSIHLYGRLWIRARSFLGGCSIFGGPF